MLGDGLDHKVRAVANISIRAEEDGANAHGQNVFVEGCIPEQETDLDFLQTHCLRQQMIPVIMLQRQEGVPDLVHMRTAQRRQIRAAVLHQMVHLPDDVGVHKRPEHRAEETEVSGRVVEQAGETAAAPIKQAGRRILPEQDAGICPQPIQGGHHRRKNSDE